MYPGNKGGSTMKWDWVWLALALGLAVGGVLYYNTQDSQSVNTEDGTEVIRVANRTKSCRSLAGEPEARFDACTAELGKLSMTSAGTAAYNKYKESRKAFSLVPLGADAQVATLEGHSDIRSALLGTDESKAAKVLRGQDFRLLGVPRDYTEAMDRDSRVIARLAHHDHIEYFQLRYIGQNVMIYSVRDSSVRMPLKTGENLIAGLRARLFNQPAQELRREIWIYTASDDDARRSALEKRGATVIALPGQGEPGQRKVDLPAMLRDLARREVNELHLEAGHKLNGSFIREGLLDECLLYVAPRLLGPGQGLAGFGPLQSLSDGVQLKFQSVEPVGDDLRILARVVGRDAFLQP